MNRRNFLNRLMASAVGLPFVGTLALACGGSSSNGGGSGGDEQDGDCGTGAPARYTNPGHPHTELTLSEADILAAIPGVYRLLAGNDHSHDLAISAQDFADLQAGETVLLVVTEVEHQAHRIELAC